MDYQYDVALSFAGEDRSVAKKLANELKKLNVRVFYDEHEESELWGKNLYQHLSKVYKDQARYCVMLISKDYVEKKWTKHETVHIQARALDDDEYILPIRIDDTEVEVLGLSCTTGYLDLQKYSIKRVAQLIIEKLSGTSTCWRLFTFLRDTNEEIMKRLNGGEKTLPVMVSSSRESLLKDILRLPDISEYAEIYCNRTTFQAGAGNRTFNCCDVAGDPLIGYQFSFTQKFLQTL